MVRSYPSHTKKAKALRQHLGKTFPSSGRLAFGYVRRSEFVECNPHEFPSARIPDKTGNIGYFLMKELGPKQVFVNYVELNKSGSLESI